MIIGDLISTMYWDRCEWQPIHVYEGAPADKQYAYVALSNEWEASQPAAIQADFTIDHLASGPTRYESGPWQAAGCSVLQPNDAPSALILPEGLSASAYQAPFDLVNVFFDDEGHLFLFSNEKDEQSLLVMEIDGAASVFQSSELLAGLNAKAGAMTDDGLLIVVDYWPDGGNGHGGMYLLQPDGAVIQWTLTISTNGLSEIVPAQDGGWLVSDFEYGAVLHVRGENEETLAMTDQGEMSAGNGALGYHPSTDKLYAIYDANWSSTRTTGVFNITEDAKAVPFIDSPPDIDNLSDLAVSEGGVLEVGVYVTDPVNGHVLQMLDDGSLSPVIAGFDNPTKFAIHSTSGRLTIVYDMRKVLLVSR